MSLIPCPNYIAGEWSVPKIASMPVFNPSTDVVIAECPACGAARAVGRHELSL